MKTVFIAVLFIIALLSDGVIIPALFGFHESFLLFIFLVALIVVYGDKKWIISFGILASFVTELLLGLYPGVLIISWIVLVWIWYIATRFFNVRPFIEERIADIPVYISVGLVLLALLSITVSLLSYFLYNAAEQVTLFIIIIQNLGYWIYAIIATTFCLLILRGRKHLGSLYVQ